MTNVLHILTRSEDELPAAMMALQKAGTGSGKVEFFDLTLAAPDYGALLEKIFDADSVEVW